MGGAFLAATVLARLGGRIGLHWRRTLALRPARNLPGGREKDEDQGQIPVFGLRSTGRRRGGAQARRESSSRARSSLTSLAQASIRCQAAPSKPVET